ncbi:hypothetical protein C1646_767346 [Rhizophagus diaphanus]|nr:hypothetical protein C1646_767346 [Rhizophagus diaphanus] [Rhizophagus sp. MUCL 43196]
MAKNQKHEQLEIISQNLEKTLGKLELDKLDKVNENDTKNLKGNNKSLIDNYDDNSIKYDEESSAKEELKKRSTSLSTKKGLVSSQVKSSWNLQGGDEIRVVVGLDFGTTYSGFSYCHIASPDNIVTYVEWPKNLGNFKTNTVLQYDDKNEKVVSWGLPALVKRPSQKMQNRNETEPVELFKLHLGDLSEDLKPKLPKGIDHEKAITNYLRVIKKLIKETIEARFQGINFHKHVLLVLTVPTEYSEIDKAIMRKCALNAGLKNLQFTTEPEAAAIYCMQSSLKENDLLTSGTTFMIVDCGGGTVDLTIHKLIGNNQLSEVTEGTGDFCGSTFIDDEFINFLCKKLGDSAINSFRDDYYSQFQYMIQEFCQRGTKAMFDPVINQIIKLIHLQLSNAREECCAMFLVGGFSESKYLQTRIKREFQNQINVISIPRQPTAVTSRGATLYGLSLNSSNMKVTKCIITTRIFKYTFGIKMEGDPIERKLRNGRIDRFHCIAKRGTQVNTNKKFTTYFTPLSPMQRKVSFGIYYTTEYDAKYCDEPGMMLLGKISVYLADSGESGKSGLLDKLFFAFIFGEMGISFIARNETNGQNYKTTFEIDI